MNHRTIQRPKRIFSNNINDDNSSRRSLNYCSWRGKNTTAKKRNGFTLLIHHEKMELAGAQGLGTGEMAGRVQDPSALPSCKRRRFVASHPHFLFLAVPHGFLMF